MKKLMIALGLVAMAAASAQAAKINWAVSGVTAYSPDTTPQGYTMACFCAGVNWSESHSVYTTVADAEAWAKSKGATTDGVHQLNTATVDDAGSAMTDSTYDTMQVFWKNAGASGTKAGDFYAVIFNADNIADATAYMVTTVKEGLVFSTTQTVTQSASLSAGTWTPIVSPVPEPTSGLLLLLGVAGMALRRKRA